MPELTLYGYYNGVLPTWSLRLAHAPDETESILLPADAVICRERDGVQCGAKFYNARNIHMLASCSLRGFRLANHLNVSPGAVVAGHANAAQQYLETWLSNSRYSLPAMVQPSLVQVALG